MLNIDYLILGIKNPALSEWDIRVNKFIKKIRNIIQVKTLSIASLVLILCGFPALVGV